MVIARVREGEQYSREGQIQMYNVGTGWAQVVIIMLGKMSREDVFSVAITSSAAFFSSTTNLIVD